MRYPVAIEPDTATEAFGVVVPTDPATTLGEHIPLCDSINVDPDRDLRYPLLPFFTDKESLMLDPATLTALAASAVAMLAALLQKAAEKGAEEIGKSFVGAVIDSLKKRLTHAGAKEAIEDLTKEPTDKVAQDALEMQLRKALHADPDLAAFLKQWVGDSGSKTGVSQVANLHGDNGKITQIVGSGNSVN